MKRSIYTRWLPALATSALFLAVPLSAQNGRIELGQITSEALAANMLGDPPTRNYQVYLPPGYDLSTNRYPVIYVLHGYGGNETTLVSAMQSSLNSLIRQRKIGQMIAVFVNGANRLNGSFYLSSPVIGDFETYITQDLVRLIDGRYRVLSSRESRGVTGYSMGGWGAMHLALKFPGIFSVAVTEAGVYDALGDFNDGMAKQLATSYPTNLIKFNSLSFPVNATAALYAGLTPNLNRPSLYTDYPYERQEGQLVLIDSVRDRALARDVQHGDLARYIDQPVRLRGIKVVHGTTDSIVRINDARQFTNALSNTMVEFEYLEHSGGHVYLPELALPFLSTHLLGAELFVTPPRITLSPATSGIELAYATQTNVLYTVESVEVLEPSLPGWIERSRLPGDGRIAVLEMPFEDEARFFRIKAANLP